MKKMAIFLLLSMTFTQVTGGQRDWANTSYSNVQFHEVEGDLTGMRVQLIQSESGEYALMQSFEGIAMPPCLLKINRRKNVFFTTTKKECSFQSRIKGVIKRNGLSIEFLNKNGSTDETLLLKPIKPGGS